MRLGDSVFRPNLNITVNGLNSRTFSQLTEAK